MSEKTDIEVLRGEIARLRERVAILEAGKGAAIPSVPMHIWWQQPTAYRPWGDVVYRGGAV